MRVKKLVHNSKVHSETEKLHFHWNDLSTEIPHRSFVKILLYDLLANQWPCFIGVLSPIKFRKHKKVQKYVSDGLSKVNNTFHRKGSSRINWRLFSVTWLALKSYPISNVPYHMGNIIKAILVSLRKLHWSNTLRKKDKSSLPAIQK